MSRPQDYDTALTLIASVRAALRNGVRHYDLAGRLLETDSDVLVALQRDGRINLDERARVDRVSADDILADLRRDHLARMAPLGAA